MLKKNKEMEGQAQAAMEAGMPIDQLEPGLYAYLEDRMTGSFIVLAGVAVILSYFFLMGYTPAFRTLLFATAWKAIDAWGRPYFQPFIAYKLKKTIGHH